MCVFVVLSIPNAKRMRLIVMCLAPLYNIFFMLSHKRHDFRKKKKKLLNTKCVFRVFLHLLSETFVILRRTERDMIENVYRSSCKVPFILIRF